MERYKITLTVEFIELTKDYARAEELAKGAARDIPKRFPTLKTTVRSIEREELTEKDVLYLKTLADEGIV